MTSPFSENLDIFNGPKLPIRDISLWPSVSTSNLQVPFSPPEFGGTITDSYEYAIQEVILSLFRSKKIGNEEFSLSFYISRLPTSFFTLPMLIEGFLDLLLRTIVVDLNKKLEQSGYSQIVSVEKNSINATDTEIIIDLMFNFSDGTVRQKVINLNLT
jgi:hypothetical protein